MARERSADALAVLKGEATVKKAKKSRGGRKLLLVLALAGAGAAAFSAVRSRKQEDPWAAPGAAWTPAAPSNKPTATPAPVPDAPAAPAASGAPAAGSTSAGAGTGAPVADLPEEPPSNAVKNFEEATAPVEDVPDADDTEGGEKLA
ncbi:hypothetical protein [Kineococcus auxinigenes]|uniref:hypothetical protein n=1 Tax=unclassified Kineococcus TaxID=2621656 RepID=UPI003D7E8E4C